MLQMELPQLKLLWQLAVTVKLSPGKPAAWSTEFALHRHVSSGQQCTVADASTSSWLDDTVLCGARGVVLLVGPAPQRQG